MQIFFYVARFFEAHLVIYEGVSAPLEAKNDNTVRSRQLGRDWLPRPVLSPQTSPFVAGD